MITRKALRQCRYTRYRAEAISEARIPLMKSKFLRYCSFLFVLVIGIGGVSAQTESTSDDYRLSVGDRVELQVHDQSDLKATQEIDEQGNVRLKYIGVVTLQGLTIRESEKAIEKEYFNQRYLRTPDVSVQILAYSSKPVIIRGAVYKPGLVALDRYPNGLDINRVIAMAGGFRDVAKESSVRVIREEADGSSKVFQVDVTAKGKKGVAKLDRFIVLPQDIIEVDESTF